MAKFDLNFAFISTSCVRVAAIVVSEIKDKLSPNIDPPITAPNNIVTEPGIIFSISTAIGANVTIVPTDVPIDTYIKHAIRKNQPHPSVVAVS